MKMIKKMGLALSLLAFGSMFAMAQDCCKNDSTSSNTTRSASFIFDGDKEWEYAEPGVVRKVMGYDGQLMVVKVKFEKGAKGAFHRHYHTQSTIVASGKFKFTIGGETKIVSAGDGLYMAPDVLHGCECLEEGVLIDCFTPMRETFLVKNK